MAVVIGAVGIQDARLGKIGIKSIYSGEAKVFERTGGTFFLELVTEETSKEPDPIEPDEPVEPTE